MDMVFSNKQLSSFFILLVFTFIPYTLRVQYVIQKEFATLIELNEVKEDMLKRIDKQEKFNNKMMDLLLEVREDQIRNFSEIKISLKDKKDR